MENLKQLPFEQKSIFHIDPCIKIFLTITVTTIMCAGKFDGAMIYIRPIAAVFPLLMLLLTLLHLPFFQLRFPAYSFPCLPHPAKLR